MKTAIQSIRAVSLLCPYCGENIYAPSGSDFWTVEDIENERQHSKDEPAWEPTCDECGKKCRLPKVGK